MITGFMQEFEEGARVAIAIEPSVESGMPFKRFNGLVGTVIGRAGRCYLLSVKQGGKTKKVISNPIHLKKVIG